MGTEGSGGAQLQAGCWPLLSPPGVSGLAGKGQGWGSTAAGS